MLGVRGWGFTGFLEADTSLAAETGPVCWPAQVTVYDTWSWLQRHGRPEQRSDRAIHGLPPEIEQQILTSPDFRASHCAWLGLER